MATLANTSGARLVGNWGETLGAGFEANNVRRREVEARDDLEGKIAAALGLGGPSSQVVDDAALGRLGQLSPQMAQAVGQAKNSPEQAQELRDQAQKGLALSEELQKLPDYASKVKRLAAEAGTVASSGGDVSRLVKLSNLTPGQLDLELQRMQLIGNDVMTSLPQAAAPTATSAFSALIAANPQIGSSLLNRRDKQVSQERSRRAAAAKAAAAARARAAAAAGPQGEYAKRLAQIEGNFARGHINEADRDQRIANLRTEFASAPGPATEVAQDIANITTDINSGALSVEVGAGMIADVRANAVETEEFDPKTDEGRSIADQIAINKIFGSDSQEAKDYAAAVASSDAGEPPDLSNIAGIRKEFTSLSGDFVTVRDNVENVRRAAKDPSAAGDMALIFAFMKANDPGSVVRESEFATAQNAASLGGRIGAAANRVLNGERLTEEQRADFVATTEKLYQGRMQKQNLLIEQFTGIANRAGINPSDVIVDFIGGGSSGLEPSIPETPAELAVDAAINSTITSAPSVFTSSSGLDEQEAAEVWAQLTAEEKALWQKN